MKMNVAMASVIKLFKGLSIAGLLQNTASLRDGSLVAAKWSLYIKKVSILPINEPKNWLKIDYPLIGASVDVTYRRIDNNLRELLIESEKLVFKHTLKADKISSNDYTNDENKVFGTLHEITGNAASQIQFHITDSTDHFIKGALYFNTKPNYDSLLPAVHHIKKDILHLMETLQWKK